MIVVRKQVLLAIAMLMTQLGSAVDASEPSTSDDVALIESSLRAAYPAVTRWQFVPVSIAHSKRRSLLFAEANAQTDILRDGNLFAVKASASMPSVQYRVAGYQSVQVSATPLALHARLQRDVIVAADRDVMSLGCSPLLEDVSSTEWRTRRPIKAGEVLCTRDVELRPAIVRNQLVTIHCQKGVVAASTDGIALSDGMPGQRIQVRRQGRYRAMHAMVLGEGEVNACA